MRTTMKTNVTTNTDLRISLLFQLFWVFVRIGPVTFGEVMR